MRREIMLTQAVYRRLQKQEAGDSTGKDVAVLGCGISGSADHCRVLCKSVSFPEPKDYQKQADGSVLVTNEWFHNALNYYAKRRLSAVICHLHPFLPQAPYESLIDPAGARSKFSSDIFYALPGMAIGYMLFNAGATDMEACLYNSETDSYDPVDLVLVPQNSSFRVILPRSSPLREGHVDETDDFSRCPFGEELVQVARHIHVGIIGANRLGKYIAIQLTNLGFPLTVVDTNIFSPQYANPSWGAHPERNGNLKTEIVKEAVLQSNSDASVTTISGDIHNQDTQEQLTDVNMFIVTTDNPASRFAVNNLAMTHGMVVFEAVTGIDAQNNNLPRVHGRIIRLAPGLNLCHACAGFFDPTEAHQNLLGDALSEPEKQRAEPTGTDIVEPWSKPINSIFAGACVWQLLRYISSADTSTQQDVITYDLSGNELIPHTYERREHPLQHSCTICSSEGRLFSGDRGFLLYRNKFSNASSTMQQAKLIHQFLLTKGMQID